MKDIINDYKLPIIGALLGFILALLFLTIGFFKTLLLIILTIFGGIIGIMLKDNEILGKYFSSKHK